MNDQYGVDGIAERKVKNDRLADPDDAFELKKRSNIASATNKHKIRQYDTGGDLFATDGLKVYEEIREGFFEICEAEGILFDLLFSYSAKKETGLMKRGRFGPVSYTHLTLPTNREV